jgi:hypothetical protein
MPRCTIRRNPPKISPIYSCRSPVPAARLQPATSQQPEQGTTASVLLDPASCTLPTNPTVPLLHPLPDLRRTSPTARHVDFSLFSPLSVGGALLGLPARDPPMTLPSPTGHPHPGCAVPCRRRAISPASALGESPSALSPTMQPPKARSSSHVKRIKPNPWFNSIGHHLVNQSSIVRNAPHVRDATLVSRLCSRCRTARCSGHELRGHGHIL